ncbi:MAG: HAMP domain-containing histidine kinase [Gemmatimonadetes bacterium]|nr:HAMP domain-containing histidine kinase [Gemmatimonadota bacterium]
MTDLLSGLRPGTPASSQERLAASIARQVQSDLPAPDSSQEVAGLVEAALLDESRVNELTLAYFRVTGAAALTALGIAGYVQPALFGAAAFPLLAPLGGLFATVFALWLVHALRRGWYRVWLRRWIPAADALIILLAVAMIYVEPGLRVAAARPGLAALGAAACLFLTFSGLMRLSGTAQRMATLLSVIDWTLLALVLDIRPLAGTAVAVILVVLGIYGTRLTLMMRRVIAYEVGRERLDHMYRAAQSAVEAREEVLRMVAHDLRNPLSTIGMTAELIADMPLEEEQRRKHARTIARCGKAMNGLIQDLLDFARMEAGRMVIEPQPTAVDALLEHVSEMMGPIAAAGDVTLDVAAGTGLPLVAVDSERISRVFSNLVGNALKFTPPGGRVSVRAQRVGEKVRFAIADTGPGIPPERVSSIFQGFWQAQSGDRRGIGLGLAIARHIVDAHGERIGVESQVGGGSEFWFTAPLAARAP